jgi:exodeoxyribonuclease V gamma subunit
MALSILSSNRVETLQSRLTQQLAEQPLRDPFAQEVIVVPTYAMARWLNLRIAQQQGVAANNHYPQAGTWVWDLAVAILHGTAKQDPYSKDALNWQAFSLLPGLLEHEAFASLRQYLDDDRDGLKRWQLAQRIADAFERYQLYRPDSIRAWSAGNENHWQARLWRDIVASKKQEHRAEVIARAIDHLNDHTRLIELPERISLFAMSRLPPVFIEFIHALACRTEILLYQHSPTDQYWADLVSEKVQARKRLQNPNQADHFDSSNSLLASWGKQGQALQDILLDLGSITATEIEASHPPGNDSILQRLQGSLFELEPASPGMASDDSVSVHLCHSPMRECQVLHNHLLNLLDRHAELSSEDILVMVPEISRYAPYIEAVFQNDASDQRPNLAWNISDICVSDGHPLVGIFLQLLKLPGSRFRRSEVLAYLECAEIRYRFGIEQQMLEDIHRLVENAQVRWGIDASQRRTIGLPAIHENTWQQAWDRFFAGYSLAGENLWQGIAPITEIGTDSGVAIARFRHLFERLVFWQQKLSTAASTRVWQQRLHQLIEEFLAPRVVTEDLLQPLRDAISELGQSESVDLSPTLVSYWMEKQLATTRQPGSLYSGGITFCGMQPMRNIPFPVICVLGMQDDAFPRREHTAEFDLIRQEWRPGDPSKGDEDRYLMLETLLCARRYLYFSYCGRSLKDNSECQPSVLLRELLDYIDTCFDSADDEPPVSQQISRVHPMQPFSSKNFQPAQPGYDQYWYETSLQLESRSPISPVTTWSQEPLALASDFENEIDLNTLTRFFSHPIRYFYNSRLGVRIPAQQASADEEDFSLQGLQKWKLAERLADNYLSGRQNDAQQFSAEGLLPHGRAANSEWLRLQSEYQTLLDQLDGFRDLQPLGRIVECSFDHGQLLFGEVDACYPGFGLMHFSASKYVSSRALLSLWLNHLALCATRQLSRNEISQLIIAGTNGARFEYLEAGSAKALLANYISLFQRGLGYPLPVFPNTSYTWALHADPEIAMRKALAVWIGGDYRHAAQGECEDKFIRLALHNNNANPLTDMMFQQCAQQIYSPAIEHGSNND